MLKLEGIVPIVPIPFFPDGAIDDDGIRSLIEFCLRGGASAVCLPAYGSEFYKLSEAERLHVVKVAIAASAGRIPVIAQANHVSVDVAASFALELEAAGADMISMAAPRVFGLSEDDLLRYFTTICSRIRGPLLIQDFNPGGSTVGAAFAGRLHKAAPNFRYLKLEDPMMGPRVRAIREATDGEIGVLEGWGGMYLMELVPSGICGVMPGTAYLRPLREAFERRKAGDAAGAYAAYSEALPLIVFELQHMELFLHVEKRLLKAMGVIQNTHVREATIALDRDTEAYTQWLVDHLAPTLRI